MKVARSADILRLLVAHDVEFIVVDMTAGVLQGVPVTTVDLDVVHRRSPENIARLLQVLTELEAVYRNDPRNLRPTESYLASPGHQLLRTSMGDMDCLGAIDDNKSYEDLLPHTVELSLSDGSTLRVLDLTFLIAAKERAGRPKDVAVLPYLRATLDEIRRRS
jgi:hypothetical protein